MILRLDYTAMLVSPVHHGGNEKTGNYAALRRMTFLLPNEQTMEIPYVDGNAIRGRLRRLGARDLLDRLGYEPKTDILYHMLMSGGALEDAGGGSGKVNVELNKRIRRLLPLISLFGTSYLNQALSGKMCVSHLLPYCKELVEGGFVPELPSVRPRSIYEMLPWTHNTRRDDREVASENVQQMIFEYEVLLPGALMVGDFILRYPNELEVSAFAHLLSLWMEFPTVGAREAQGHGRLRLYFQDKLPQDGTLYLRYLEEQREAILALLEELDALRKSAHKTQDANTDVVGLHLVAQ